MYISTDFSGNRRLDAKASFDREQTRTILFLYQVPFRPPSMTDSRFRFLYEFNGELIPRTCSEGSSTLKSLLLDDVIQAVVAPLSCDKSTVVSSNVFSMKVYRSSLEEMNHILENRHRHVPLNPAPGDEIKHLESVVGYNIVIWSDGRSPLAFPLGKLNS